MREKEWAMSRLSVPRFSTAVSVVAVVVALLAVMFPGFGFGQTTFSHGGPPSDVYTQTNPDTCLSVGTEGATAMEQELTLGAESHLLVYFSFEWGALGTREEGKLSFELDGTDATSEWSFPGNSATRTSGTVMWSFEDVPAGTHIVDVFGRVDPIPSDGQPPGVHTSADVNGCALTVIATPVAA
jgi:hypothetical protein